MPVVSDEGVDAQKLMVALSAKNKQLVLGTEVLYETAKTFRVNPVQLMAILQQ
jgi:hypothetical protein